MGGMALRVKFEDRSFADTVSLPGFSSMWGDLFIFQILSSARRPVRSRRMALRAT